MARIVPTREIDDLLNDDGWVLLESYKKNDVPIEALCPEGHLCRITISNYRSGARCRECARESRRNKLKLKYNHVKDQIERTGYTLLSKSYVNNKTHLTMKCPENHIYKARFDLFTQGFKCKECHLNRLDKQKLNNDGPLNKKLRISKSPQWILKYMTEDFNYNLYKKSPSDYNLDHIIPIKGFVDYYKSNSHLDLIRLKKIANHTDNLQLLHTKENGLKSCKYDPKELITYIEKHYKEN